MRAFMMGFDLADAVAMLRLDDLYLGEHATARQTVLPTTSTLTQHGHPFTTTDSFEVTDVKMLKGDHLSRAIGRIAGQGGKTRYAIENATRTRIVVADSKVHILGAYANIKVAKDTICSLIMGAPPGKVYNQMYATLWCGVCASTVMTTHHCLTRVVFRTGVMWLAGCNSEGSAL